MDVNLHVDLETLQLIQGPGQRSAFASLRFKRGDAARLRVVFLENGFTPVPIGDPDELEIQIGIKPRNQFDHSYLAHSADWSMPAEGDDTPTYECELSLNTLQLNTALNIGSATDEELPEITLMGEITWREGNGEPTSTRTFLVVVENDVNRGTEGAPSDANPGNITTIANDTVTNAKLANMATATIKGRTTAGTGDPEDLTAAEALALIGAATPASVSAQIAAGFTLVPEATINFANSSRLREGLTDAGNGGAGGIAMVCSLDYEFKWEAGRLYVMGQDGFTIRVEQYGFSTVPTATDDATKGYVVGSRRILDNGLIYLCTDASEDAAVWVDVTAIKIEGGGIVVKGTSNPTASGANTGVDSFISGSNNYFNSGSYCQISGSYNISNSGSNCSISGYINSSNSGTHCSISGYNNFSNSGNFCSISGRDNYYNVGSYCQISGNYNYSNTGSYCQIGGYYNYSNSGTHCSISGSNNFSNSGNFCSISGRDNRSNSGNTCSISGFGNFSNSGSHCQISGYNNYSNSGNFCQISGYYNFSNSGTHCSISGSLASFNTLSYARIHGGGDFARIIDVVAKAATTNDTPTTLTLGGAVEGSTNRIKIPANSTWSFTATIVARETATANAKTFTRRGLIGNNAGEVTISALDTIGTDHVLGTLAATIAITADNTNDALKIVGTGVVAKNIRWTAQVNITQVG